MSENAICSYFLSSFSYISTLTLLCVCFTCSILACVTLPPALMCCDLVFLFFISSPASPYASPVANHLTGRVWRHSQLTTRALSRHWRSVCKTWRNSRCAIVHVIWQLAERLLGCIFCYYYSFLYCYCYCYCHLPLGYHLILCSCRCTLTI